MRMIIMLLVVLVCVSFVDFASAETVEFKVKKGDNFWKLAKHYKVKHALLIELNKNKLRNSSDPNLIYPGQIFTVQIADAIKKDDARGDGNTIPTHKNTVSSLSYPQFNIALAAEKIALEEKDKTIKGEKLFEKIVQIGIILICLLAILICFLIVKREYDSGPKEPHEKEKEIEGDLPETIMKKNVKKINAKNSIFIIKDHDDISDSSEDRCFVGVDEKNNFHCIGTAIEMSGTALEVAKFAARIYGKEYENSLVYIDNKAFGEIFSVRPLRSMEKIELENKIMSELHDVKT